MSDKSVGIGVACLGYIVLLLGVDWCLMVLWNYLVPPVFHGPRLSFLQVLAGVTILGAIGNLFKSSGKASNG